LHTCTECAIGHDHVDFHLSRITKHFRMLSIHNVIRKRGLSYPQCMILQNKVCNRAQVTAVCMIWKIGDGDELWMYHSTVQTVVMGRIMNVSICRSSSLPSRVRETFELNQLKSAPSSQLLPVLSGFDRLQTCCH
jgi:hypothetical protein